MNGDIVWCAGGARWVVGDGGGSVEYFNIGACGCVGEIVVGCCGGDYRIYSSSGVCGSSSGVVGGSRSMSCICSESSSVSSSSGVGFIGRASSFGDIRGSRSCSFILVALW